MFATRNVCALLAAGALAGCATTNREDGFVSLFNGQNLDGWTLLGKKGDGYGVKDGIIYCAKGGGGNLLTEKEYSDFILRLDFRLEPGSNNGVAIRSPLGAGSLAYLGTEIQILDDTAPQYAKLQPGQYCGSIYQVVPAKRGALAPVGQWNSYEITYRGRHAKVVLNGKVIVDTNLNDVNDPAVLAKHPGMLRDKGHIGFLGHNDYVEFRNLRIKELPVVNLNNVPPEGFTKLFNGRNLEGWKGLVADPAKRVKMSQAELAAAQAKADAEQLPHWRAVDGEIVFDGKGKNLCTVKDYADYEMLVDWKILPLGDSGIYLRGCPQVQIWDKEDKRGNPKRLGSGGLYNNKKNPTDPLVFADHFVGDWNRFRILIVGDKVHVFLNDQLVVNNVTLENYWEREKPLYPSGSIELQNHGNTLWFRNIYVREINAKPGAEKH
ncbi:MAG: DUF1080 domain-containing protein [Verrucomicrobia bacterium]|nr:DUF1080 domain-containing protein [Verrucomicrobiota bacterium]